MPHILIHFRLNHNGSAIYTNAETTDKPINGKLAEEAKNQIQPSDRELDSSTRQIHARSSRHHAQRVVPREMPQHPRRQQRIRGGREVTGLDRRFQGQQKPESH